MYGSHIVEVHLSSDDFNEVPVGFKLYVLNGHFVHLFDDARVVWCEHLCAVFPVGLVAIVFLRVVACSDVHSSLCSQLSDGKRDFRRWAEALE